GRRPVPDCRPREPQETGTMRQSPVPSTQYSVRSAGLSTGYSVLGTLLAALFVTTGCQSFRNRPAYSADPLLWDRKPVAGRSAAPPAPAEPQPPPAPPEAPPPERIASLSPSAAPCYPP